MFKLARFAAAVLLAVGASTAARAQDDEKVTVSANLVSVNVSVTDSRGRRVQGLSKEQFEVFDDGVRQRVAHFSAGDAPFSVGVVYDMHPTTRERASVVLEALKRFVGGLRAEDDFFLLVFNERTSSSSSRGTGTGTSASRSGRSPTGAGVSSKQAFMSLTLSVRRTVSQSRLRNFPQPRALSRYGAADRHAAPSSPA